MPSGAAPSGGDGAAHPGGHRGHHDPTAPGIPNLRLVRLVLGGVPPEDQWWGRGGAWQRGGIGDCRGGHGLVASDPRILNGIVILVILQIVISLYSIL